MDTVTSHPSRENLDEILVRTGLITTEVVQTALQTAQRNNKTVEQVLFEHKLLTPRDLA